MVSGEYDIEPDRSRRPGELLPSASSRRVEGVGHYLPLEAPDALTSIIAHAVTVARRA